MSGDFEIELGGHVLEFYEDDHIYLVDGIITPSITQIIQRALGKPYQGVSRWVLEEAAARGTALHEEIENYCLLHRSEKAESADESKELKNFKFLQRQYKFDVIQNEVPVILFKDGYPAAAGRCDLVLEMDGEIGGADIKRTSSLDKERLAIQLNLYRMAYRDTYGVTWQFLRGVHLRDDVRKFVKIPINESYASEILEKGLSNE